jgi:glyoxylase-like metal-dependent hydrolase (beta-lactamase superfamily II)
LTASNQTLIELAPQVWVYPKNPDPSVVQPNIGVIRTSQQTILVDAGSSPRHARRILADLYAHGFPPVRTLIYTHHHWDHVVGSTSYHPTYVIAHNSCAEILKAWVQKHWTISGLREEMQRDPFYARRNQAMIDVLEDWREMRLAMPNITFSREMTLHEDDLTITIQHVGGAHAEDSSIVKVSTGPLFVGDSYYPGFVGDDRLNYAMMESFLTPDVSVIVDGHGPPRPADEFRDYIAEERAKFP